MIDNIQETPYPASALQSFWEGPVCPLATIMEALPPGAQRTRELFTIVTDPRLLALVQEAEMVEAIEKTETGYRIYADKFSVDVTVKYLPPPPNFAGPVPLEVEFADPVPYDFHILPYPPQIGSLPPAEQRLRELAEVFRRLPDVIGYLDLVENIQKTDTGYFVRTENSSVVVDVIYLNPQDSQPADFELEFGVPK